MIFQVVERNHGNHYEEKGFYLIRDRWDDFKFRTAFDLIYVNEDSENIRIGWIKIGKEGEKERSTFDIIPKEFASLDDGYYSLGQNVDYYTELSKLGSKIRETVLTALNDVAFNLSLFEKYRDDGAMQISLLRNVPRNSVKGQLHRVANGGALLTEYDFSFSFKENNAYDLKLSFAVKPNSTPPTNIHALIGRNGVGKTTLIKKMLSSIYGIRQTSSMSQYFKKAESEEFANIVLAAFSPFEDFSSIKESIDKCPIRKDAPFSFIGLLPQTGNNANSNQTLAKQFMDNYLECIGNVHKRNLWLESLEYLKSDPTFKDLNIGSNEELLHDEETIESLFESLSSGHKVVLLLLTCCVAKTEEKSLVIIDEPENHLHPPLLSALIRALSFLLIDRNGVAIIATHSPVVLQEIPSSCVWKIRKNGNIQTAERPNIQTFGSNVGALTREVFGLEVEQSGFHKLIKDTIQKSDNIENAINIFDQQLGDEALLLLKVLFALKGKED